jgi:hypothetical protein
MMTPARAAAVHLGSAARGRRRSMSFPDPSHPYHCVYHRFMEANVIVR